jgi:hypothetical protein
MYIASKEGLETLVDVFRLAIRLGMVRSAHLELNACKLEQELPELTSKNLITVETIEVGNPWSL